MADAPKQSRPPVAINYRKIPQLSILRGSSLTDMLSKRARSHTPTLCVKCGNPIRPGEVILRKEFLGHVEFIHSSCSFSRPHISEPRFYK
jgi:hypothetical protein